MECVVGSALVDRVGVYGFETPEGAALTYLQRVTAEGVTLGAGNCLEGTPGDAAWTPGDGEDFGVEFDGERWAPDRAGCFVNDEGFANFRATCGGIYIGVLGNTEDLAALSEWAERSTSTDTPTPPGICAG